MPGLTPLPLETASFIVPKKPLNLLKNAASNAESVSILLQIQNTCFAFDEVTHLVSIDRGQVSEL